MAGGAQKRTGDDLVYAASVILTCQPSVKVSLTAGL